MLSQTSEHAIRALLFLAQRPAGEAVPATRIAAALGAPANYLAKTLNALARTGLVASTRGPSGGFRLRRAADRITLAEIDDSFGEARPAAACLLGDRPCDGRAPCAAHARWAAVCAQLRAPLRATTLADLLAGDPCVNLEAGATAGVHGRTAKAA
ncbi:MAG: RrF2 family transcriptional regulator [Longimicrobiaceae bacterium]